MRKCIFLIAFCVASFFPSAETFSQTAKPDVIPPKVLLLFSLNVEADHALFAIDALRFFTELSDKDGFRVDATTN